MDFISFNKPLNSFVKDLSGGIKQQVSLAVALLHDPEIIFLDEPTSGVSPLMRERFWSLIREVSKLGKTVFVTTHYMDEAEHCERIALMKTGEIIALDTPDQLKKTYFPEQIFELDALGKMDYKEMQTLQQHKEFQFFEPYGLRFHVEFTKGKEIEHFKEQLKEKFKISMIKPTMEDVFIKAIEGKER